MATISESIRNRIEQHKAKNDISKNEDKLILNVNNRIMEYLRNKYEYSFSYNKTIKNKEIYNIIADDNRVFDYDLSDCEIRPDGGVIYLDYNNKKYPILISEFKHQGTNDKRIKENKPIQDVGNAVERLGKNVQAIKTMMHKEDITPFVCFGDGCDFAFQDNDINLIMEYISDSINSDNVDNIKTKFENNIRIVKNKVYTINEYYPLNKIFVSTTDNNRPISMMFRYKLWTEEEIFNILKLVVDTSMEYYIDKYKM